MPTSGKCTYLAKSATLLCCLSPILVEILPIMQISSDILVRIENILSTLLARFQGDSSCLTIDNIKPELCPNSAPLYWQLTIDIDNSARDFPIQAISTAIITNFNPLSRVLKRKYKKNIQNAAFYHPWKCCLTKFFKTFRANPRVGKVCRAVTGGGLNIFAKIRQHTCTISFPHHFKSTKYVLDWADVNCSVGQTYSSWLICS